MIKKEVLTNLIHAIRGELTVYNFSHNQKEKDSAIWTIENLLNRTEHLLLKTTPNNQSASLTQVVESILSQLDNAHRKRVVFDGHPLHVAGDEKSISIIAKELIDNALKYSTGKIYVSIHAATNLAVLRIEDFGPGLPEAVQEHIAEPFISANVTAGKQTLARGHGLGLSIAWTLVQQLDGGLTILTSSDGTTALVTLDIVENFDIGSEGV